jgi:hypothetical protein
MPAWIMTIAGVVCVETTSLFRTLDIAEPYLRSRGEPIDVFLSQARTPRIP